MSLENAIAENTAALKQLIAALNASAVAATAAFIPGALVDLATDAAASTPATTKPATKPAPVAKPVEAKATPAKADDETVAIEYSQVSEAIMSMVRAKGKPAAVALLGEFNVTKGTDLKAEQYAAFLARAEELAA